ncbi:hypothetical protein [Bradyrhizobium sp. SZCCHNRI3043]|nr:hypothetical protein [Bradyrhizobium sp. SZCCHNRI3043]
MMIVIQYGSGRVRVKVTLAQTDHEMLKERGGAPARGGASR